MSYKIVFTLSVIETKSILDNQVNIEQGFRLSNNEVSLNYIET